MVFGEYVFAAETPPWMSLAVNPEANALNNTELGTLKNYVQSYMKDPKNFEIIKDEEIKDIAAAI